MKALNGMLKAFIIIMLQTATYLKISAVSEKLAISTTPLRFIALSTVNPRKKSYKPHMLRNYSSLAIFLSLIVEAYAHSVTRGPMVSSENHNIRKSGLRLKITL